MTNEEAQRRIYYINYDCELFNRISIGLKLNMQIISSVVRFNSIFPMKQSFEPHRDSKFNSYLQRYRKKSNKA